MIWQAVVSKACEKVPALAQLKKWSLGDPLMNKLAACSTSLRFSATFVVGSAVSHGMISNYSSIATVDSSDVISEVAKAALWLSWF